MPLFVRSPLVRAWSSFVQVAHTGTTSETTLATIALPPMGPNDYVTIDAGWSMTSSLNNKTLRVRLGSTSLVNIVITTNATYRFAYIFGNRNSSSSQVGGGSVVYGGSANAISTASEATASGINLLLQATLASSGENCNLEFYRVELWRP